MNRYLLFIALLLLSAENSMAEPPAAGFAQRGYLDDGRLLSGQAADWEGTVDSLLSLGFTYIGNAGATPAEPVTAYLDSKGLPIRAVTLPGNAPAGPDTLWVVDEPAQKLWMVRAPERAEGSQLLWSDDGSGSFASLPADTRGFRVGVLIHAGGPHNGPVQDPYPGRIGESLSEAASRGLSGNVLVYVPDSGPFLLNLEAAAAAMREPGGFDSEAFYLDWTGSRFGAGAAPLTVKSLKLLHGAHEHFPGFNAVSAMSSDLLASLQAGKAKNVDLNPVADALRLSRRSLDLAAEAASKVPKDRLESYRQAIEAPATLFIQNLELLETLSELSGAWKIHTVLPTDLSSQRVRDLIAKASERAGILQKSVHEVPGAKSVKTPSAADIEALEKRLGENGT